MKIGIVSDSHEKIENIKKAVGIFNERKVEFVFGLGDYISPPSVRAFKGVKLIGVFGNNDGETLGLIKAFNDIGGELLGDFGEVEKGGLKFALYHGTSEAIQDALIKSGKYDVVLCGHTHEAKKEQVGKTLFINPGSANGFGGEATIAVFDTSTKDVEFIKL